jgi:enolase-phosphatase E1
MPIKAILTDIEGTTSAVSFVFDVLFPYAARHLPDFVRQHATRADVAEQLDAVRRDSDEPGAEVERVIEILLGWIAEDRKATPLKALQGMVWEQGYQAGQLKGHVYPDAVEALQRWHRQGFQLFVYSSGSIQAQKLIFGCSEAGDLSPLFTGYFDTTSGPKREAQSYRRITQAIVTDPVFVGHRRRAGRGARSGYGDVRAGAARRGAGGACDARQLCADRSFHVLNANENAGWQARVFWSFIARDSRPPRVYQAEW